MQVGGQGEGPPGLQAEFMGRVELELRLVVIAVAPFALVAHVIIGPLGADPQLVEVTQLFAEAPLREEVPVGLGVR